MTDPLLRKYRDYPRMAHWFNPLLLLKLLSNVVAVIDERIQTTGFSAERR